MESENFSLEMRGYKRDEVDRVISELRAELEHLRDYNFNASSEADSLRAEIAALKKKKDSSPGYAELGAQFEQTLRLAEEQAKKLVQDAGQDAGRQQRAGGFAQPGHGGINAVHHRRCPGKYRLEHQQQDGGQ